MICLYEPFALALDNPELRSRARSIWQKVGNIEPTEHLQSCLPSPKRPQTHIGPRFKGIPS